MKKFNNKDILDNVINLPDYWNVEKVINAFDKFDTFELYEYFGCTNSAAFTRLMKDVFPNRPDRMPYSKYVRSLLVEVVKWTPGPLKDDQEY